MAVRMAVIVVMTVAMLVIVIVWGVGVIVHGDGVARAGRKVNGGVIALRADCAMLRARCTANSAREDNMGKVRLRQLVIAAHSLDVAETLATVLGLGEAYVDPGVGEFGLVNRVNAIGDQFLEVVVPTALTAPAGRFLGRGGEGGYMAIFQTDDLAAARARADALEIRRVWNVDLKDISASHLHPADVGAAIVSIDEARPAASWRWGGPNWEGRSAPGKLTGAVITSREPEMLASRWAEALGVKAKAGVVELSDAVLEFRQGTEDRLVQFVVSVPDAGAAIARAVKSGCDVAGNVVTVGGVGLVLT